MNLGLITLTSALQCIAVAGLVTLMAGCGRSADSGREPERATQSARPVALGEPVLHANIDTPAPGSRVTKKVVVAGWAFATGDVVREIEVSVDGNRAAVAAHGGARPDVATQFPEPGASQSGWYTEFDVSALRPGKHEISVRAILQGGSAKALGTVAIIK
jgi:hypothetical protein